MTQNRSVHSSLTTTMAQTHQKVQQTYCNKFQSMDVPQACYHCQRIFQTMTSFEP